jgi:hypothetical protein
MATLLMLSYFGMIGKLLQTFPFRCIGGAVKIELLGRIEKQASDHKYTIW